MAAIVKAPRADALSGWALALNICGNRYQVIDQSLEIRSEVIWIIFRRDPGIKEQFMFKLFSGEAAAIFQDSLGDE